MSLETAIQENTKALYALMEHMKANVAHATPIAVQPVVNTVTENAAPVVEEAPATKPTVETPAAVEQTQPVAETKSEPKAEPVAEPQSATREDAQKAVLSLSRKHGKDAAMTLLGEFGAVNLSGVSPEQYAALVAKADQLLAQDVAA